jgi:hypothetical protein
MHETIPVDSTPKPSKKCISSCKASLGNGAVSEGAVNNGAIAASARQPLASRFRSRTLLNNQRRKAMDDFHIESTEEETIFIALSAKARIWSKTVKDPFRAFFDGEADVFVFPLPASKTDADNFRNHLKAAGFKLRELV